MEGNKVRLEDKEIRNQRMHTVLCTVSIATCGVITVIRGAHRKLRRPEAKINLAGLRLRQREKLARIAVKEDTKHGIMPQQLKLMVRLLPLQEAAGNHHQ